MHAYLDFERPIADLEGKIVELRQLAAEDPAMDIDDEVERLQAPRRTAGARDLRAADALAEGAGGAPSGAAAFLGLCRGADRRIHAAGRRPAVRRGPGDRRGAGRFRGRPVAVIGQEKGNDTKAASSTISAWRCPKAIARRSACSNWPTASTLPVLSFVDTPGAYPGVGAEERGQAEAIARSTQACLALARAVRRHDHRRRHVGRRDRHRGRQPRLHAGAFDLFGDLAGRLRLDPVAQRRQGAGRRRRAEDHRAGPAGPQSDRRHRAGAGGRCASRGARPPFRPSAKRSPVRLARCRGSRRDEVRQVSGATNTSPWAATSVDAFRRKRPRIRELLFVPTVRRLAPTLLRPFL